jgi:hypothetical protein
VKIFEALVSELKRLKSVSNEQFNREMRTNKDLGILVFAAKEEIESIAWCSVQVAVAADDVENKEKVNGIVERILGQ